MHTSEYLGFGKALLVRLFQQVKVYITNLLSAFICNSQKTSCLEWNSFVWILIFLRITLTLETYLYWTLKELFIQFCVLGDLLKLQFFTRWLYFHHWWRERERKNQFFNYFWKMLLKFEEKKLRIQKLSQFSITWILKKLRSMYKLLLKTFQKSNYLTGTFWAKPI